jgi:hypothetical protein
MTKVCDWKQVNYSSGNCRPQDISVQKNWLENLPLSRIETHQKPDNQENIQEADESQDPTNQFPAINP